MITKKKYIPHAWETVNCQFCNSNRKKIHEKFGPEFQYTYIKCLDCGLIYQSPRPKYDETFLKAAYSNYFIFDPYYQYSQKVVDNWKKEVIEILKFDKRKTAILDIGSAMGDFLNAAGDYYNRCCGVEVAENMANFVEEKLKLKVYVGTFDSIDFQQKFSCIHMSHVIEHIPNPAKWLRKSKDILEEKGILALSVPNMLSLDRRFKLCLKKLGIFKGRWKDNSRTPDHLFEPTIKSTLKFLKNNGFSVLDYYSYSRNDMDASTIFGKLYNRKLKLGSNLRFFATPINSNQ